MKTARNGQILFITVLYVFINSLSQTLLILA